MNNDKYLPSKIHLNSIKFISIYLFRIYQLEKDDGSDYSASIIHGSTAAQNSISSSKMSITGQSVVIIDRILIRYCFCVYFLNRSKRVCVVHNL
jgi:hypothetical protein